MITSKKDLHRTCNECGNKYISTKRTVYCTDACAKRVQNRIKHAIEKAHPAYIERESIARYVVYTKHGLHCAVCGIETIGEPGQLDAPEIDHIIPLSKGGSHTYDNIQLLCRMCNIKKGSKAPSEYVFTLGRTYRKKR